MSNFCQQHPFTDQLQKIAGPWVFGTAFDLLLRGSLTAQIYVYYLAFPKDRLSVKLTVTVLYGIALSQTTFAMFDLVKDSESQLCQESGNVNVPRQHIWFSIVASSAIVAVIAQILYAHKLYILPRKIWLSAFIVSLSLLQLITGFIGSVCSYREESNFLPETKVCLRGFRLLWGPVNVACDVTISVCMTLFLFKKRRNALSKKTRIQVAQVIQLIIQTGTITSITVICYTVTLNLVESLIVVYVLPGLLLSKLYSNSVLALLNNRSVISKGRSTGIESWNIIGARLGASDDQNWRVEVREPHIVNRALNKEQDWEDGNAIYKINRSGTR